MKALSLHIKKHIYFLLTAVFIISGSASLCAKPEKQKTLHKDSATITSREPSQSTQDNYYGDETWRYDRDKVKTKDEPNVFDRMWNGFWEKVMNSFTHGDHDRSFNPWTILWILILVTIVVLVILKVTNSGVSTIFSGKTRKSENINATLEDVDIHSINYEQQILAAISNKDFRLAVRLWFLRTLKSFSDKELVHWQIDKTNSDYYYELSGTNYQKDFGDVSKVYDYIWYGEFPVDESSYKSAEEKFSVLNKKVSS
jgi:hypothetical protein